MTPVEVALRARTKLRQVIDSRRTWDSAGLNLACSGAFPRLPLPEEAPDIVRQALRRDVEDILAGRWKAFGHLALPVDDPPKWHRDYLAGKDLATSESGFNLNHRALPSGADVKLIWELSRWYQLVRLAMGAYVLHDERARRKCIEWLEDWVTHNPPYRGWNWTSALEVGIRLVQFTWIDALLTQPSAPSAVGQDQGSTPASTLHQRLARLRQAILPAHVWYAWRHRSCGSSANNHLLGELAGCVLAIARWPTLAENALPLEGLRACWEREVLAQFAGDGGNREQALNYHLFSFEFCWQTLQAFEATGVRVTGPAKQRLNLAGRFFSDVQVPAEPWDYGDSDNAFVTPFFTGDAVQEWRLWLQAPATSPAITYWLGEFPGATPLLGRGEPAEAPRAVEWRSYLESGIATCEADPWRLRWDVSPLGYLTTAAHGHLDALHLSVWYNGVALVVDPGTGAYFFDERMRTELASRAAHNGPRPEGTEAPRRMGPFLWSGHHPVPTFQAAGGIGVGVLNLWGTVLRRRVAYLAGGVGWQVEDDCSNTDGHVVPFSVRWQFAPGSMVTRVAERTFSVERRGVAITVQPDESWAAVDVGDGIVSPVFREVCRAPYLGLTARPLRNELGQFRTIFTTVAHR